MNWKITVLILFLCGVSSHWTEAKNEKNTKNNLVELQAVSALVETEAELDVGDADDPCIWLHPTKPEESLVIGTDKDKGLLVFDLDGKLLQQLDDGEMNNADVRYGIPFAGKSIDIVAVGNRSDDSISLYSVNAANRRLEPLTKEGIQVDLTMYGSCLYRSPKSGKLYVFVNSELGEVEQWEIVEVEPGQLDGEKVRTFQVDSKTEGCVADDELGFFYFGEEEKGIWKVGAEPEDGDELELMAPINDLLDSTVEGLAIYFGPNGSGYLIASCQSRDEYAVYERNGKQSYLFSFQIEDGDEDLDIDGTEHTDGIDVIAGNLGPRFPQGLFVAQDGDNKDGDDTNFKFVSWGDIARISKPSLIVQTKWNPRKAVTSSE